MKPIALFGAGALILSNGASAPAMKKVISGLALLLVISMLLELITGRIQGMSAYSAADIFGASYEHRNGGGFFAGSVTYFLYHNHFRTVRRIG